MNKQIYVFGDSYSDVGHSLKATGIPPSPPYSNGSYSNGLVWWEYLAIKLGAISTNFAFAGATTGRDNAFNPDSPQGLVPYFAGTLAAKLGTIIPDLHGLPGLQQQINAFTATNTSADSNALYVIWTGVNDYVGTRVTDPTVPVNNLSIAVTSLAAAGAKNIMVFNLQDLGKLPGPRIASQISTCLSTLTSAHNSELAATLDGLSQKLGSDINVIPVDASSLFNRIIAAPGGFGFTNVTDSCLTEFGVCDSPDEYFFWDDFHPTTAGHKLVAELVFSALEFKPIP